MKTSDTPRSPDRQILGFSLKPELARAVKAEAGKRGLSLKAFFEELWELYQQQQKTPKGGS